MIFVITGLAAVALLAMAIWRAGIPAPSEPANMADGSAISTTVSPTSTEAESLSSPTTSSANTSSTDSQATGAPDPEGGSFAAPAQDDPFLAPNAVAAAPSAVAPTSVHRPDNVGEQSRFFGKTDPANPSADEPVEATLSPTEGTEAPGTTGAPGSSEPTTEPGQPSTGEPTPEPTPPTNLPQLPSEIADIVPGTQTGPDTDTNTDQTAPTAEQSPAPVQTEQQQVPSPSDSQPMSTWPWPFNLFSGKF